MRPLVALALLLATPASASAAPFGELPSQPQDSSVGCLAATGAPGELVWRGVGAAILETAGPDGLRRVAELGTDVVNCPRIDARPNGAGVVALQTRREAESVIQAAVREPGGAWGSLTDVLATPDMANGNPLAAAASDRGDAVVVAALQPSRLRIVVTRRAPGGAFGAPETLFDARTGDSQAPTVQAGMTAAGEAVVAWSFRSRSDLSRELWAAIAPPGGAFSAPARIGELQLGTPFSLAVGAGGHALLAFATGTELRVAERAPGAAFAPSASIARVRDPVAVLPAAAIDAAGGAIVAWERATDWHVEAVVRPGPGAFGAPVTLARPERRLGLPAELISLFTGFAIEPEGEYISGEVGPDAQSGHPRAVIDASGRALLGWVAPADRDGVWWSAPWSATLPLAGGPPEIRTHGSGLRDVRVAAPLLAAGGVPAVAWGDEADERDPRLHLALEGAPATPDKVPLVRIRGPRKRVLARGDALVLRVTCSAACEVRAQVGSTLADPTDTLKLTRAGSGRLRLTPELRPLAPLKRGPVRVRVRTGAPDARLVPTETVTVNLRRRPGPPPARIVGATARRSGDAAVVRWRMTRAVDPDELLVMATVGRGTEAIGIGDPRGGTRRFTARIGDVARARYVTILGGGDAGTPLQVTRVRIRG